MGSAIISAIESGIGLMGKITEEFGNAFTGLFWDPGTSGSAGTLTAFGTWTLVMLGVSITFAVVSLVLNLIRSNTGV